MTEQMAGSFLKFYENYHLTEILTMIFNATLETEE